MIHVDGGYSLSLHQTRLDVCLGFVVVVLDVCKDDLSGASRDDVM